MISAKEVQPSKALCPIAVRVGSSVIKAKDVQPWKAHLPTLGRAGGSMILVCLQSSKAYMAI